MRTRERRADEQTLAPEQLEQRPYLLERVGEAAVVQLYADGFAALPVRERVLVWHLAQAAIAGRDIYYDQRYAHNLEMRELLEALVPHWPALADDVRDPIVRYTKLFWINAGPYNNLTAQKFVPDCSAAAFADAVRRAAAAWGRVPTRAGESLEDMLARITRLYFDRTADAMVTNKTPGEGRDILTASANNLYEGVTMADLERAEEAYPLNSRLVKHDGRLVEEVYRVGGRYSAYIERICRHLEDAVPYATSSMARALQALVLAYRTGGSDDRRAYDIAWVEDRDSPVDTINGFVEVYMDARGRKGAWEGLVYYLHPEKTAAMARIAEHAQWFEDRMPWDPRYRKPHVTGVTARAIEVVIETGDSGPVTPIGINLPNDQEVRERYGSKSVTLSNVLEAYEKSTPRAFREEFSWDEDEVARATRWGAFASELTTNLHEVIGHGSGLVSESLRGLPEAALKEHFSAIEEARADLVALYFIADPHMVELGLVPADDHVDIVRTEYEAYARNALVQLRRVREGTQIEEDHMRNRQLIVRWLMAHTQAITTAVRDGRTYYRVTDPAAFRAGAARLLAEVQRIKAEGDYSAARTLVERYGVRFDPALRDEIVTRVARLDMPSYTAFVMPRLEAERDAAGAITDVAIAYPCDLTAQMLEYAAASADERARTLPALRSPASEHGRSPLPSPGSA
jgi:dipeptidyl-peptidase-3